MAHGSRHFPNNSGQLRRADSRLELITSLKSIIAVCPPDKPPPDGWSFSGLYCGPTSTAFLFFKLSLTHPDLEVAGKSMRHWCLAYLRPGSRLHPDQTGKLDPSHCGIGQEKLVHIALRATVTKDASLVEELCSYADRIASRHEHGSDEWLYGRAGYLYLLRLVSSGFATDSGVQELVRNTSQKVIHRMLQSPVPWEWHGKAYLGAVHGAIGIITQIVLSFPSHAPKLQDMLKWALDLQYPSGNFPSSVPVGSDRLVQFCHGAPGFVISLVSLRPHFPALQSSIDNALEKARACIWERGLLTKEPSLCHGITANALAFDDTARFEHFLSYTARDELERRWKLGESEDDDAFYSLYVGEAGRAWGWAVADAGLGRTCLGFNDL